MAIRLKLEDGSTIEADSVQELVAYQRASAEARNGSRSKSTRNRQHDLVFVAEDELPRNARMLVDALLPNPKGVESAEVARLLGVSPRGMGGYVTALASWGKRRGLTKRQLLEKGRHKNGGGKIVRTISLSGLFRKMLKEGQVPGMKLDT